MAKSARKTPVVKKETPPQDGTIVINNMPIILRNVDRTGARDVGSWWDALQQAEKVISPNRTRLYDVYKTVILDAHLSGIIEKRIGSIINKKVCFKKDGEEQEEFQALTDSSEFRRMMRELMWSKFWGISGMEFIPGDQFTFKCIPRKHIKPEKKMITKEQSDYTGFSYDGIWNIWVVGQSDDHGILMSCSPYIIWKKSNMGDWAQYIEIFGQPFVVGKYNGFDAKTKLELDETMRNFGGSNRMMIPVEANIDIIDGKSTSNGNGDLQDKFRQACNEELSVLILGATETTSSSQSSGYAQSKTHSKQQDIILKADMIDVMDWLNCEQFLAIAKGYGYNTDAGQFEFEAEVDIQEVQAKLNIATQVNKITPVSDDHIYELSGVPKPDNYDQLKAEKEAARMAITGEDDPAEEDDETDPEDNGGKKLAKKKKEKPGIKAALKGLTWWEKLKAVFSTAP
ncbi:MAG: phage portal protein family protein [Bacteroidota bacterium]